MRTSLIRLCAAFVALGMLQAAVAELPLQVASVPERARRVQDVHVLKVAEKTGRIPVTLPDGTVLRFIPQSVRERQGVSTLRATIGGARLLLTSDGRNAFGFVATPTANYRITTVRRETWVIEAGALPLADGVPLAPSMADVRIDSQFVERVRQRMLVSRDSGAALAPQDAAHSIVDIAIFLDPALLLEYSPQALRTLAQANVDYTNEAFLTNGASVELNLVLVEMHTGTFVAMDPFPGLVGDPGAAARADAFGADIRHFLYVQLPGIPYCGKAYLVGNSGATGLECGAGPFAHEVGHNFGAHHDRANAGSNVSLPIASYNFGFVCGGDGTIMSYVGAARLPHYSEPVILNKGEACGVAFDQPNGAHNGHVIEVMRQQIESFRAPQVTYGSVSLAQGDLTLDETGGPVDIMVTRDGDLSRAVSVEVATMDDTADEQFDYLPVLTRLEFAAGEATKLVRVQPVDDEDHEQDQSFRLVLRYPLGLVVAGAPVTITLQSDDVDRGLAEVSTDSVSVWENGGPVTITINRTGNTANSLSIQYSTVDGTGRAGGCYQAVTGALTFAPGETTKTVQVPIINNDEWDASSPRYFTFSLSGANLGARTSQYVWVFNEDPNRGRSEFALAAAEIAENAATVNVEIRRIEGTESTLLVNYATADGTALAGRDYDAASGSFTFSVGEVARIIPVTLRDNGRFDGNRSFVMTLTGQALGSVTSTTVTIVNDDPNRGLAEIAQATQDVAETAGSVSVIVQRVGGIEDTLTVNYATESGTATAPRDYTQKSGAVSFAPGVTSATIDIPIAVNIFYSTGAEFTVRLSGELIGTNAATTVRIVNDDPNRGKAQFSSATSSVGEAAGTAHITVSRIDAAESDLVVNYASTDGSARAGRDYTATSGILTFAAGETSRTIDVPILNNTTADGSRTFTLALTGDFLGTPTTATVTITNDDQAPPPEKKSGGGGSFEYGSLLLLGLLALGKRRRTAASA